jgi:hypothetical protein
LGEIDKFSRMPIREINKNEFYQKIFLLTIILSFIHSVLLNLARFFLPSFGFSLFTIIYTAMLSIFILISIILAKYFITTSFDNKKNYYSDLDLPVPMVFILLMISSTIGYSLTALGFSVFFGSPFLNFIYTIPSGILFSLPISIIVLTFSNESVISFQTIRNRAIPYPASYIFIIFFIAGFDFLSRRNFENFVFWDPASSYFDFFSFQSIFAILNVGVWFIQILILLYFAKSNKKLANSLSYPGNLIITLAFYLVFSVGLHIVFPAFSTIYNSGDFITYLISVIFNSFYYGILFILDLFLVLIAYLYFFEKKVLKIP